MMVKKTATQTAAQWTSANPTPVDLLFQPIVYADVAFLR